MNQERFRYGYNGIEELTDFGLGLNHTLYRLHDPALARWNSVDPKASALMSLSPYNSMNNSPLMYTDPNGDLAWFIPVIAGAVGGGLNLWKNWDAVQQGGLGAGLKAFGIGAVAGVVGAYAAPTAVVGGTFWGTVGSYAASGAVGGGVAGAIEGSGNAWLLNKANFGDGLAQGISHGVMGAAGGAVLGGLTGAGAHGFSTLRASKPPSITREQVFEEFIDPYANSTASGGGKSIKGSLWGGNKSNSSFINTLDAPLVVSAPKPSNPSYLSWIARNTTRQPPGKAINLEFNPNISAREFYSHMNPNWNGNVPSGFKSPNGIKWSIYQGGNTNPYGFNIKGMMPNRHQIMLRFHK